MTPLEDYRAVYALRTFIIARQDLSEFFRCSEEGIWPRVGKLDGRVLGLWTTLATTDVVKIVLLTAYHGPAHWEETRVRRLKPEAFAKDI